jgi:hypothetical protein
MISYRLYMFRVNAGEKYTNEKLFSGVIVGSLLILVENEKTKFARTAVSCCSFEILMIPVVLFLEGLLLSLC